MSEARLSDQEIGAVLGEDSELGDDARDVAEHVEKKLLAFMAEFAQTNAEEAAFWAKEAAAATAPADVAQCANRSNEANRLAEAFRTVRDYIAALDDGAGELPHGE